MTRTRLIVPIISAAALITPTFALGADDSASSSKQQQQSQQSRQQQPSDSSARQSQSRQSDQQAPEGFVIVDERVVTLTANEPQNHFLRAHEFLNRNDTRGAAAEMRIAAGYLDMQASRDKGQDRQSLSAAADHLRQVADELANGQAQSAQQTSSKQGQQSGQQSQQAQSQQGQQQQQQQGAQSGQQQQVIQAFASADQALAEHFERLARQELQSKKSIMAGHDLDASASAFRAACAWAGQKPDQEAQAAISDAQRVALQLISHEPVAGAQQSQATNQSTSNNASAEDEAQPAGARIGSSEQQQQGSQAQGQSIPPDAQKAVDQLGQVEQKLSGKLSNQSHGSAQTSHDSSSKGQSSSK